MDSLGNKKAMFRSVPKDSVQAKCSTPIHCKAINNLSV